MPGASLSCWQSFIYSLCTGLATWFVGPSENEKRMAVSAVSVTSFQRDAEWEPDVLLNAKEKVVEK